MELFLGFVFSLAALALGYFSKSWRPFFAALWLCIFCLFGDLLGIALIVSPQGRDFLIALETSGSQPSTRFHPLWFFASLTALAFSSWACARALMFRLGHEFPRWIVEWFPRIFGLAPLLAVLAVFFFLLDNRWFTLIALLLVVLFAIFVFLRRLLVKRFSRSTKAPAFHDHQTSRGMKLTLGMSLALALVLFILFLIDPVTGPQVLGAPGIALLAVTSWVLFGSVVLVLWPRSYGWPSLAWLPIVLAIAASYSNENYRVREVSNVAVQPPAGAKPVAKGPVDVASDFDAWLKARQRDNDKPFPVFIVTAEGGGVRAAYWAASVLTRLQSQAPDFARHVYAISGVSGGSLGGATFVALLRAKQRNELPACANPDTGQPPNPLYDCAQAFLARDFMSPTLAYLFYEDLMQRFIFLPFPRLSRATALERAWERGWTETMGTNTFEEGFARLWEEDHGRALPALFMNGTMVESGNRLITSNVPIVQWDFPDAIGTFDETLLNPSSKAPFGLRMPLSTAVHMSARFTYASPPGRLVDDEDQPWGHVIDGGYFENSGAGTAFDLYTALVRLKESAARGKEGAKYRNVVPVLVLVTNSPSSHARDGVAGKPVRPIGWLTDLLSPPLGLLNAREARGRYLLATIRNGETRAPRQCVINFGMSKATSSGHDPILGWFLAEDSRVEMRNQLQKLDDQVDRVKRLLLDGRCV